MDFTRHGAADPFAAGGALALNPQIAKKLPAVSRTMEASVEKGISSAQVTERLSPMESVESAVSASMARCSGPRSPVAARV